MLEVAEALAEVLSHARPGRPAVVSLGPTVLGHVLAEEVLAEADSPPFPKSLRDGYAVRAADCGTPGTQLKVVEELPAGSIPSRAVSAGECARIFTGAPIPEGADAVVMQEETELLADGCVRIADRSVKAGQYIFARGTEMRAGDVILQPGAILDAVALGVLAGLGKTAVALFPAPRVAVLSTGDELVEAGDTLAPGQIRNSNGPMLQAQAVAAGGNARYLGIARDDPDRVRGMLEEGLSMADVLVVAGGVSVGKYDLVPRVLHEMGVEVHLRQVRMKPGKPFLFGTRDGRLVFGLPGNPVSAFVCFSLFVLPALRAISGHPDPVPRRVMLPLAEPISVSNDRPTYHPAKLEPGEQGFVVHPLSWMGAPDLRGLLPADAFLVFPPGETRLDKGQPAAVLLWK
jgi:molybdopterin molybdotransferase